MSASEGDVNLSAERRSFQAPPRRSDPKLPRRGRALVPASVAVNAVPERGHRRRRQPHRRSPGAAHPRFPRQQCASRSATVILAWWRPSGLALDAAALLPARRCTNKSAIDLARRLAELAGAPGEGAAGTQRVGCNRHGTEARPLRSTGGDKTLSMWDAFHGANLDAVSVGGEALVFERGAGPLPRHRACAAAGMAARLLRPGRPRA